jgi:hypothetical protein
MSDTATPAPRYTVRYNRTAVHISGIAERTRGSQLNYAVSACPALSRSGVRMATKSGEWADVSEALAAAQTHAKVYGLKMCAKCEQAAQAPADAE